MDDVKISQGSTLPGADIPDAGGDETISGLDHAEGCTVVTGWFTDAAGGRPDGTM